jgi:alanine-synthesizing transaminase
VASLDFFREVVAFARRRGVILVHDFAYCDVAFDGYKPPSILQVSGAKDVAVEFSSLTKSFNMAGWRMGFAAGQRKLIEALEKIKSYTDYGTFGPIQVASITALDKAEELSAPIAATYQSRRDALVEGLNKMGVPVESPKATLYVWLRLPPPWDQKGSFDFSMALLKEGGVVVSPGSAFGDGGEGYVRIALVENVQRIRQALKGFKKVLGK